VGNEHIRSRVNRALLSLIWTTRPDSASVSRAVSYFSAIVRSRQAGYQNFFAKEKGFDVKEV
jgi:hypothetical protein